MTLKEFLSEYFSSYSGCDLSILVNEAFMKPLRSIQTAKYFRHVKSKDQESEGPMENFYTPCDEKEEGSFQMSLKEIPPNRIVLREADLVRRPRFPQILIINAIARL